MKLMPDPPKKRRPKRAPRPLAAMLREFSDELDRRKIEHRTPEEQAIIEEICKH